MAETWLFKNVRDVTNSVTSLVNMLHGSSVSIIGTYDELYPILNDIVKNTDFELYDVEFLDPVSSGYYKEYGITLDDEKHIYVERAIVTNGDGAEVALLFDNIAFAYKDVDERILKENDSNTILFDIDYEDNDDKNHNKESEVDKVIKFLKGTNFDCVVAKNAPIDLFDLLFL